MSLMAALSVSIHPARLADYEEGVQQLAARAVARKDGFQWTAHQTVFGEMGSIHFVSELDGWSALEARGPADDIAVRVMGKDKGSELIERLRGCVQGGRMTVSRDRPELSCLPDELERVRPTAVVTTLRARPGGHETCEELIRKLAEAIPKVDDPGRIITYETLIGDLASYVVVRPLESLADLDDQLQPADLLSKAFGAGEGGLIYRTGVEAIETVERQIVVYREDLSNPS